MRLISYSTKPESASENRSKIEAVFAELHDARIADFAYTVVQGPDGSFWHLVDGTPAAMAAFQALPAFEAFSTTAPERQLAPSTRRDVVIVGSYGNLVRQ